MQNNRQKGNEYEERAITILQESNYAILVRNFRISQGEVDIIAEKDSTLVFVEVKYRKNTNFGYGKEAVDRKKLLKIFKVAEYYKAYSKKQYQKIRIDVIHFLGDTYFWDQDVAWGDEIGCEVF
ncbi:MAG TPA: YraN family protein [Fusobacterium sp.]|uniref:YraN family protein n=1 Tax=Fusobacterium sp. TaxID=68766 RepID=UPI002F41C774